MTRGATEGLLDALAPRPGEHFVDLASGPGEPALELARRVGPGGSVLAVDPVPDMLAELSRRAAAAGLEQISTHCSAVEDLVLPAAQFDGLSCRFGAMFFQDPAAVLARLAAALKPGGRCALLVWGAAAENPYFTVSAGALDAAGVPAPQAEAGVHGVFEHAEPGALAGLLRGAGWIDVRDQEVRFDMLVPEVGPPGWLEDQAGRSPVLAERLAAASDDQRARAIAQAAAAVAAFVRDDGLALPALARVVSARTPA